MVLDGQKYIRFRLVALNILRKYRGYYLKETVHINLVTSQQSVNLCIFWRPNFYELTVEVSVL